jgi:hypothetical protein
MTLSPGQKVQPNRSMRISPGGFSAFCSSILSALASFSSGNFVLGRWLADATNRAGDFLANRVNAVYFLDPRLELDPKKTDVKAFVAAAMTWAKGTDKRLRLYAPH